MRSRAPSTHYPPVRIYSLLFCWYCMHLRSFCLSYNEFWCFGRRNTRNMCSSPQEIEAAGLAYAIGVTIIDFILEISLIALFTHKMCRLTVDLQDIKTDEWINYRVAILSKTQQGLLSIMTQCFILSLIATLSTQIQSFLLCFHWISNVFYGYNGLTASIGHLYLIFWALDCIINSLCLFLIFEANVVCYNKTCKGCNALVRLCFKGIATKQIQRQYGANTYDLDVYNQLL
eukprot:453189_1